MGQTKFWNLLIKAINTTNGPSLPSKPFQLGPIGHGVAWVYQLPGLQQSQRWQERQGLGLYTATTFQDLLIWPESNYNCMCPNMLPEFWETFNLHSFENLNKASFFTLKTYFRQSNRQLAQLKLRFRTATIFCIPSQGDKRVVTQAQRDTPKVSIPCGTCHSISPFDAGMMQGSRNFLCPRWNSIQFWWFGGATSLNIQYGPNWPWE